MNTVTAIASALTRAGPITQNSIQVFNALTALINNHGTAPANLADPTFVTQLIAAASAALNHAVDPSFVSSVSRIIAATNAALEQDTSQLSGQALIDAVSGVERLTQGAVSDGLQKVAADPDILAAVVNAFTGSDLANALAPLSAGNNHAPSLATDSVPSHGIGEIVPTTGSNQRDMSSSVLLFTDADLSDTHQVSAALDPSSIKWMNPDGTASSTTLPIDTTNALVNAIQVALLSDSTNGNIGEISWTFSAADHYFDFLGTGESLRLTYNIAVSDKQGGTGLEPVAVVINGSNDNPLAIPDSNGVAKGSALSVSASAGVLANDTDLDVHDHLAVSSVNGSISNVGHVVKGTYGSLMLNADGSYRYVAGRAWDDDRDHKGNDDHNEFGQDDQPSNIVRQDVFTYATSDGHGGTTASTLTTVAFDPGSKYQSGINTTLVGGNGSDILDASAGHDKLFGGNGPDVLIGGNGDALTGGLGRDTFLFRPNFGTNVITDFNVNNDVLQFDKSIFANVNDVLRHTTNTVAGAIINDSHGDTITLAGITLAQLQVHQGDFHLI